MSRFFKPEEAVRLRLLGNQDYQQRDRLRLLSFAPYVYRELNMLSIKKVVRKRIKITKRTNSIDMPCEFLKLCSINIEDRCGIEYPVYRNHRILEDSDVVDVGAVKNCACEYKCGHDLCNTIKSYVATIETVADKMPDGTDVEFECVSRKGVDDQGFFYEQLQYPKRIYEDGEWVDTVLYTETNKKCKVEVDENGCCCDTEANIEAVCTACGIDNVDTGLCCIGDCVGGSADEAPNDNCHTWTYYCDSRMDWLSVQCGGFPYGCPNTPTYNISELGNRIIFPANFGYDTVIVRWYEDVSLKDMEIPVVAIDTFVMGLMAWDTRFNDKKQNINSKYEKIYGRLSFNLIKELNKYRITDLAEIMAPRAYIPSAIQGRTNKYEGGGYFYSY
jgi:hypothetical protein